MILGEFLFVGVNVYVFYVTVTFWQKCGHILFAQLKLSKSRRDDDSFSCRRRLDASHIPQM